MKYIKIIPRNCQTDDGILHLTNYMLGKTQFYYPQRNLTADSLVEDLGVLCS